MFYIGLYRVDHEKIFLSETTRPRALIFGRKHQQVSSEPLTSLFKLYPLGQKWPAFGVICFT